jgi:hypothetical protein
MKAKQLLHAEPESLARQHYARTAGQQHAETIHRRFGDQPRDSELNDFEEERLCSLEW